MVSIFYLYTFIVKENKLKNAVIAILLGFLASLANFVLLNFYLVSFGLIMLLITYQSLIISNNAAKEKVWTFVKLSVLPLLIFIATLLFMVPLALKLKEAGALFYGANSGFWKDTVNTITDRCFYELNYNYWFQRIAKGIAILILLSSSIFVIAKYLIKEKSPGITFTGALLFLILICSLSTIVQHKLFGTLFLIDRTALFLVVLFNLLFVFFINELTKTNNKISIVSYLAAAVITFHFVSAFNLHYVLEWKPDSDIKEMIVDLDKIKVIPKEKNNIKIGTPLEFVQSLNFYRAKNNLKWINTAETSNKIDFRNDYFFLEPLANSKFNLDSIEIIKTYPITNNILAKPKYPPASYKICFEQKLDFENTKEGKYIINKENEYSQGFSYTINDSILNNKNAGIDFKATVLAPDINESNFSIIISVENKKGLIIWERAFIKDYIRKKDEWTEAVFSSFVPKDIMAGDELKAYIWNPNKQNLQVKNMELKWIAYDYSK